MNLPDPNSPPEIPSLLPPPLPPDIEIPTAILDLKVELQPDLETIKRGPLKRFFFWTVLKSEWMFGLISMVIALATLAAIPGLQFLSLGYMLESSTRVAKSGKIRDGFIGIRTASRLGGAILAIWLLLLPLRYLSNVAFTAQIINPDGRNAARLRFWVLILTVFVGMHVVFTLARGGRLRHFFWPLNFLIVYRQFKLGGAYTKARDTTWDFLLSLRLHHYFWLGLRGFLAAFLWLIIPVTLLAFGQVKMPLSPLVGFFGALLLAIVVLHLPLLQTQMAIENSFRAAFDWRGVRRAFNRAPWACSFALILTLIFALPLYLLKIEVVPQEALWLPTLVFILFIFPARLITGWAMWRTKMRDTQRHWFFRWSGRLPLLPAVLIYLLFVFFSQYTSWNGIASLYEQHAFLLPVPFLGL